MTTQRTDRAESSRSRQTGSGQEIGDDQFSEVLRRHLVVLATTDYDHPSHYALPGVADEVAALQRWWCDEGLGRRRFNMAHLELSDNPALSQVDAALRTPDREWNDGDAAVVVVTGHGLASRGAHWIVLRRTDPARLHKTAISTDQLIGWLADTDVEHLLVILDLCFAAATAERTVRLPEFPDTWLVLASTGATSTAAVGALTGAVTGFLDQVRSREGEQYDHGPYLRVDQFLEGVQARLPDSQRLSLLKSELPRLGGPSPCLPNPRPQPAAPMVDDARRDLAVRAEDLETHWAAKTWLFTGRAGLMGHLVTALSEPPRTVVVTGGAGTGKSAVLGRLVTLSDTRFRRDHPELTADIPPELLPPVGSIDAAILGTGKLPSETLTQLLEAVGVSTGGGATAELARWHTWLVSHDRPVTVVIDALDECSNPDDLLASVLAHLHPPTTITESPALSPLRLILGVRSPGAPASVEPNGAGRMTTGTRVTAQPAGMSSALPYADQVVKALHGERVPVDEAPWWDTDDLAHYATEILTQTPRSPYHPPEHYQHATAIASTIASGAGKSFLLTRLAATNLSGRDVLVDSTDPGLAALLDDGVLGVFRADLHHEHPDSDQRLRAIHLLRAVAFAYGRGLPWSQIWPLTANAVADRPGTYGDSDIAALLASRLAGYLVTDHEDGITVYRLFHDTLRTTLREQWRDLHDAPSTVGFGDHA